MIRKFTKKPFKLYRLKSLALWREKTGRTKELRRGFFILPSQSSFVGAFECTWQNLYGEEEHNSLFCSMGEFSTNIDDILSDKRLDRLNINDLDITDRSKIFRYYVRVLIITEQIIEDFQKVCPKAPKDAVLLKGFINSVIKHRVSGRNKFHQCNQHINVSFNDFETLSDSEDGLNIKNYNVKKTNYSSLEIPTLDFIISTLVSCYVDMDDLLKSDTNFVSKIQNDYTV